MTLTSFLPHEHKNTLFLTDSGAETTFIFKDNIELREFAAFEMLTNDKGRDHFKKYYRRHVELAHEADQRVGFVLESATWRASADWMEKLGYGPGSLQDVCDKAITLLKEIQAEYPKVPMVVSGNIGPRSDGYVAEKIMSVDEAQDYHKAQISALQTAGADIVMAATLNYIDEGIGIVKAAQEIGIPVVLSFTLETNGCLPTGEPLQYVIETIDQVTNNGPAYYMINCSHPTHFSPTLISSPDPSWKARIGGIRANASKQSHAELDKATELDDGNPVEFGQEHLALLELLPNANVFGGCCGTDHRHVLQIRSACMSAFQEK
jgi:S-methylmethionine-dependent homocysteine/selenocysteine methylase